MMEIIKYWDPKQMLLAGACLLSSLNMQAQAFWNLAYSFPGGPKTGIALAGDSCLFVGLTSGVIQSCDDGFSFDNTLSAPAIFTVYATKSKQVLAGGSGKIYYTNDVGQSWDSVTLGTAYPVTQIIENQNGALFAITGALDVELGYVGDGVFYSADRGASWTARNNGLGIYKSCERIAVDKNGRLYLGAADEYSTGAGGLFVSDNDGLLWEHVDIDIDGQGVVEDRIKIVNTRGLSVSPDDQLYFSFSGIAGSVLVELNVRKPIDAVKDNTYWSALKVFDSVSWWLDRPLFDIHFAENGHLYSSAKGTVNSRATYYSTDNGLNWNWADAGLGVDVFGLRNRQFFVEKSNGRIFMVQLLDERIYQKDTNVPTPVETPAHSPGGPVVYPNPLLRGEKVHLQIPGDPTEYHVDIFDVSGRRLASRRVEPGRAFLDAPATPGTYFLRIVSGEKQQAVRLLVQ